MARPRPHTLVAVAALGALSGVAVVSCGGASNGTEQVSDTPGKDAGQKDSTAPLGNGDGDDVATDDATTATSNDASGDAGNDGSDDAESGAADDAGDDDAEDSGSVGAEGGPSSGDAGEGGAASTPDAGGVTSVPDSGSTASDGGSCDFSGTWGSELSIDVTWAAGGEFDIVIAPGSGTIKQWLLSTRTVNGTTATDTAQVCGIQLPDFEGSAIVGETYGIRFPNSLFDSGDLSTFTIPGTLSGSTPTSTYTTPAVAVLLGLTLANPTTAAWPTTITTEVDEDLDGNPGVTANVAQGGGFSNVPLDFSVVTNPTGVARADRLYLAIRQITSVSARFSDCDDSSGSITVPQIGSKYAIDSHVIGCGLAGSTSDCTASETSFVDQNQPVFVPSATSFVSMRMPANTTCATVRGTFQ